MTRAGKYSLFILTAMSAFMMAGCSSSKPIYYNNGKDAHILSCTGATWAGCLRDAGAICADKGYEILEKSSGREYGFFYDNTVKEMVISCGLAAPAATLGGAPSAELMTTPIPSTTVKLGELGSALESANKSPAKTVVKPKSAPTPSSDIDAVGLLIKQ